MLLGRNHSSQGAGETPLDRNVQENIELVSGEKARPRRRRERQRRQHDSEILNDATRQRLWMDFV